MELEEEKPRSLRGLAAALAQPSLADDPCFAGFAPADAEEIAQELDLYVRAADAGRSGKPPASANPPDRIEATIAAAVEGRARDATLAYAAHLGEHDARI